jgi:transposase-like protein
MYAKLIKQCHIRWKELKSTYQRGKEAILKKMLPPHNKSVPEIAEEEGISQQTLYTWRRAAREKGRLLPAGESTLAG